MWGYKAYCKATKTAKNRKIDKNETVIQQAEQKLHQLFYI